MSKKIFITVLIWIIFTIGFNVIEVDADTTAPKDSRATVPEIIWEGILPWPENEALTSKEDVRKAEMIENAWFFDTMLPNIIKWWLWFLATCAIVVIMIGGYMHLTSFGGEQTTKGKETIMYGVIGLLIVILSYAIVRIVQNFDFFI